MATSWQLTRGKKIFKLFGLAIVLISVIAVVAVFSFLGISLAALVDGVDKRFGLKLYSYPLFGEYCLQGDCCSN